MTPDSGRVTPSPVLVDERVLQSHMDRVVRSGAVEGESDPLVRIEILEAEGIVAEVLFPNGAPFQGGFGSDRADAKMITAGRHAYNRWLAEFVNAAPGRFAGQVMLGYTDIDDDCQQIREGAAAGLKGVLVSSPDGGKNLADPCYEPIWATCDELGMVLNCHVGALGPEFPDVDLPLNSKIALFGRESFYFVRRPFWQLVWGGVFDRHPSLTMVFTEGHSDWVPALLRTMDHAAEGSIFAEALSMSLTKLPSEYFADHCYLGSSLLARSEVSMYDEIGPGKMMFGADFPHLEGTYGHTHDYIRACCADNGMTDDTMVDFLGATATDVFGFDVDQLAPIAARVGPDIDDLLTPLSDDRMRELALVGDILRPPE